MYGGTKEEMARLIKDASKMKDVQKELNVSVKDGDMSFGNIVNAISVMQKKLDIAGTTAKEASTTISGSIGSAKSAFENFLAGTGGVEQVVQTFTTAGTNIMNAVIKMAPQIISGLIQMTNAIIPQIPSVINKLLPTVITGAMSLINGLIQAMPQILTELINIVPLLVKNISSMLPQILQSLILMTIMIVQAMADLWPTLIPQIVDAILQLIPVIIDNLPLFIKAGYQVLIGLLKGILNAVPVLLSHLPKIGKSMLNYWKQLPSMFKDIGKNIINGLVEGMKSMLSGASKAIKNIGKSLKKGFTDFFQIHSPSRVFAWIGEMNMQGLYNGMEDMQPKVQQAIDGMFDLSPSLYGSTSTNLSPVINVTNINNIKQDPLGQMVNDIKTFAGGSKNDYNYGMGV